MSDKPETYVLDANAFIQAHRQFYGLDFCPGYWTTLLWHRDHGRILSIDRVRDELLAGEDALSDWVEGQWGAGLFPSCGTPDSIEAYRQIVIWVAAQPQFREAAKAEFQRVADGWLAAFAKAHGHTVVTLEIENAEIRKRVPLPNVCRAFDVPWITPFEMLRRLGVRLGWAPAP